MTQYYSVWLDLFSFCVPSKPESVGFNISLRQFEFYISLRQYFSIFWERELVGLLVLGLTAFWDSISVYIGPSPKEREKEEGKDRWE